MSSQVTKQFAEDSSLQMVAHSVFSCAMPIGAALEWMKEHGQSVLLNWGEDDSLWECSWITNGVRYTGEQESIRLAILESLNKAFLARVKSEEVPW